VHRQAWPQADAVAALAGGAEAALVDDVAAVLTGVRKAKSEAQASMRADVASATVTGSAVQIGRLTLASDDIRAAGRIADLVLTEADGPITVTAVLAVAEENA
jgi:valyl-tRNA synthetase